MCSVQSVHRIKNHCEPPPPWAREKLKLQKLFLWRDSSCPVVLCLIKCNGLLHPPAALVNYPFTRGDQECLLSFTATFISGGLTCFLTSPLLPFFFLFLTHTISLTPLFSSCTVHFSLFPILYSLFTIH